MLRFARWLFLFQIAAIPLVQPFDLRVGRSQVQISDVIFAGVCFFTLAAIIRGELPLVWNKLYTFFILYASAFAVSTLFSDAPARSGLKLLGVFYLIGVGVAAFSFAAEPGFIRKIFYAWFIGTALTILAGASGIAMFYAGYDSTATNIMLSHFGSLPAGHYPRIDALFVNANMMCNYLNVSLIFLLVSRRLGWLGKKLSIILIAGTWAAAFFTFSLGLGGMALSAGLWYFGSGFAERSARRRWIVLSAAISAALIVLAIALVSVDTKNTDADLMLPIANITIEPSARVLVWENTLSHIGEHPVIGLGTGADAALVKYNAISGQTHILLDAHNMWLNVTAQSGIIGLAAFLLLIGYLFSLTRFTPQSGPKIDLLLIGLSCAFAGAFIYQGLTGSFEDARHLWVMFGLMAVTGNADVGNAGSQPA